MGSDPPGGIPVGMFSAEVETRLKMLEKLNSGFGNNGFGLNGIFGRLFIMAREHSESKKNLLKNMKSVNYGKRKMEKVKNKK